MVVSIRFPLLKLDPFSLSTWGIVILLYAVFVGVNYSLMALRTNISKIIVSFAKPFTYLAPATNINVSE